MRNKTTYLDYDPEKVTLLPAFERWARDRSSQYRDGFYALNSDEKDVQEAMEKYRQNPKGIIVTSGSILNRKP